MKRFFSISMIIVIAALFMTSCTMERRVYRPGYHVDWNKKDNNENHQVAVQQQSEQPWVDETLPSETHVSVAMAVNDNSGNERNRIADVIASQPVITNSTTGHVEPASMQIPQTAPKMTFKRSNPSLLMAPFAKKMGGDNQIVALLLCFFLGILGVHSFYLGNKKKGIIQLVLCIVGFITFPFIIGIPIIIGLSIWVLIDFIRIIIGDLGPGW